MRRILIPIFWLLGCVACKRQEQVQPASPANASNSQYTAANLSIAQYKDIRRNELSTDTVYFSVSARATFGTLEQNLSVYAYGHKFDCDRDYSGAVYYSWGTQTSAAGIPDFDAVPTTWEVRAANGYSDMSYETTMLPFYKDTIPYAFHKTGPLTIPLTANASAGADSIHIRITGTRSNIDTAVVNGTAAVTLDAAALSAVFTSPDVEYSKLQVMFVKWYSTNSNGKVYKISSTSDNIYDIKVLP